MALPIQTAFNGGKFGSRTKGRSDLQRYNFACDELQNFIPTVQGAAVKRSGTRFVTSVIQPNIKSRLFPFNFSEVQSYVLEVSEGTIRFYRNSGALLEATQTIVSAPTATNPVQLEVTGHNYSNGDSVYVTGSLMTELNDRFFVVANATANTIDLSGEDGLGRVTGIAGEVARHYDIKDGVASDSIPWLESELDSIQFVQNGDLMYLVHPNHPPHEIVRSGDLSWTCTEFVQFFPALETENEDRAVTMSIDNPRIGTRTITATGRLFTSADIGRVISMTEDLGAFGGQGAWIANTSPDAAVAGAYGDSGKTLFHNGRVYRFGGGSGSNGSSPPTHESGTESDGNLDHTFENWGTGYGTITAVGGGGTTCTVTVTLDFPASASTGLSLAGAATYRWAFGAWDAVSGYPRSVAFYEDRLWFGGTDAEPQTVWGSRSGEYDNFRLTPADLDDAGVQFTFLSDTLNTIQWMQGSEILLAGTAGGEFSVDSGSAAAAITPSNVRVRRRSKYGSKLSVQPKALDSVLVFVRQNADIHKLTYNDANDRYIAPDLTQFAHNILRPGAVVMDYQPDPFRQLWVVKENGLLAAMTFDEQEDVIAWCDVVIGGTNAVVESIAVIPHPDGDEDQMWLSVRRTVNGQTARFIEILEKPFEEDDVIEDAFFVDAGATYDGAPATAITGLWHLEGEEVVILADGARVSNQTVSSGTITLADAASVVHVGLQMGSTKLRTLPWNTSTSTTSAASSQGWYGKLNSIIIQVDSCGDGLEYGSNFSTMDTWNRRTPADAMDAPVPLFTGFSPILDPPSDWEQTRQIAVRYDEPLPCTIVAFMGQAEVSVP